MKLQRKTLLLLLAALGFAGVVYVVEIQGQQREEARVARSRNVFTFTEDRVQEIQISQPDTETLVFERQAEGETQWVMTQPKAAPASDASVTFLLDKLTNGRSDRTLTVSESELSEYGLDNPSAIVDITLTNGKTHQLVLGQLDFSESFIYAQVDPPVKTALKDDKTTPKSANVTPTTTEAQSLQVLLVPIDFQYAVDRPLSEWEQQEAERPIQVSPSPSPTLETSPSPTLGESPSPTLEESPETSPSPTPEVSPSPTSETSPSPTLEESPEASPSPTPETSP
ncbi:MAG: DUF4340 domain-containing protein [Desertifilum sp.]|nr:DUF4340 domain-containing protein [Desertifilum sp.]